jgi:ADP-heptose:LPS heptosyltransferase
VKLLVIRLGALGDIIQSFGPFAAIRAHHPDAHITLLTTPPFAKLLAGAPWFDAIRADGRPGWRGLVALARGLRAARFDRVYDLQTSGRSSRYRWLVGGAEWSGIGRGASHKHANPARDSLHTMDRQREQLEIAGIRHFPPPDLGWLDADLGAFGLPERFCLLVPGASPLRPGKRWPAARFGELAALLDLPAVVIGAAAEAPLAVEIREAAPSALDLTGRTSLPAIAALARRAAFAIGNDTGPTHLIAAAGCPTLALFGGDSDPGLCAPRGAAVRVLRHLPLAALPMEAVAAAIAGLPRR